MNQIEYDRVYVLELREPFRYGHFPNSRTYSVKPSLICNREEWDYLPLTQRKNLIEDYALKASSFLGQEWEVYKWLNCEFYTP